MIDERKLVELLKQRIAAHEKDAAEIDDYAIEFLRLADEVQAIIEVIEEQPKVNEWISCSERLPKLDEGCKYFKQSKSCLCTVKWWDEDVTEEVGWYNQTGNWNLDSDNSKVIAWMPLPEPYKPE